jgi:hypothetical protein
MQLSRFKNQKMQVLLLELNQKTVLQQWKLKQHKRHQNYQ